MGLRRLFNNMSWMLIAELLSRLSRFVTLFVLAKFFSNTDYGIAMLALVIHELFRVFTKLGTGAKIIQCEQEQLKTIIENATSLQWFVALSTAILQIMSARLIASFYEMPILADLLSLMALSHLFYPIVSTRIFEQQRENKLRYFGIASGLCIAFENLLIALLVYLGFSVVSVAWAKVAASLFWVALFISLPTQLNKMTCQSNIQKSLIAFSFKTLTSELSRMLRFQSDSLIAGRLLSPDLFGIYSFAKSAGLGIAQTFSQAYLSALYPYLCKQYRRQKNLSTSNTTWKFSYVICLVFLVQAISAQYYIVWLFDDRWLAALDIASILCLVAIPNLLIDHLGLSFRAINAPDKEATLIFTFTLLLIAGYLLLSPTTPLAFAYVSTALSLMIAFGCVCLRYMTKTTSSYKRYSVS